MRRIPIFNFSLNVNLLTSVSSASDDAEDVDDDDDDTPLNARRCWTLTGKWRIKDRVETPLGTRTVTQGMPTAKELACAGSTPLIRIRVRPNISNCV